jgi:outer membrane lipoprotein-sorting protein
MRTFLLSVSLMAMGLMSLSVSAEENAREIMKKSQDAMTVAGSESINTLIISDGKGNERVRKFSSAQKADAAGKVTKMVMRFLEPADVKGTGILTFDYEDKNDDMWLYMPALRKVRRIVSREKTKSFMGSEFSNADITKPQVSDYSYRLLNTENVGDIECWKIEMTPSSEEVRDASGYSKKIGWVGKSDYTTRKTEFYDLNGALVKVMKTDKVRLLDEKSKKYQPVDISMENVQNGRSSRFLIKKVIFNPGVKDEYFSTDYLQK